MFQCSCNKEHLLQAFSLAWRGRTRILFSIYMGQCLCYPSSSIFSIDTRQIIRPLECVFRRPMATYRVTRFTLTCSRICVTYTVMQWRHGVVHQIRSRSICTPPVLAPRASIPSSIPHRIHNHNHHFQCPPAHSPVCPTNVTRKTKHLYLIHT